MNADEPALALVVSGGHTHLYLARPAQGAWTYRWSGARWTTRPARPYDKVAKLLGFGYPGGPWIDALARFGDPKAVPFAFSQIKTKLHLRGKTPGPRRADRADRRSRPAFLFSFSGIKTAVLRAAPSRRRPARPTAHGGDARYAPSSFSTLPPRRNVRSGTRLRKGTSDRLSRAYVRYVPLRPPRTSCRRRPGR